LNEGDIFNVFFAPECMHGLCIDSDDLFYFFSWLSRATPRASLKITS
jgi:hypothetical protein